MREHPEHVLADLTHFFGQVDGAEDIYELANLYDNIQVVIKRTEQVIKLLSAEGR